MRGLAEHPLAAVAPRSATEEELLLCHTHGYIAIARHDVLSGAHSLSTGDTDINRRSFDVALRATGTCLNAIDLVMEKKAENAFSIVRPPGHHASAARGMGFCLFNNIAVAARYAQRKHGVERVAIVDWDVHHGNGTQDIFFTDPSVFFFSTHQSPWYPGTGDTRETGEGAGKGGTLNCPFPAGAGRDQILGAFQEFAKKMDEFRPDLLLISAGFDSRTGDPLGGFLLSDADFAELTTVMRAIADKHARRRLLSILEGGYNLDGLSKAVYAHAHSLLA